MKKIRNTRRKNNDYFYEQSEIPYIHKCKYYKIIKHSKNSDYCNNKLVKYKHYINDYKNNVNYFPKYFDFKDCDSFFPKNYIKYENETESDYNQKEIIDSSLPENNNIFTNNEIIIQNNINNQNNHEETDKIQEDKNINKLSNNYNNYEKKKFKKYSIKSIPHPKMKKEYENKSTKRDKEKMIYNHHQKLEEKTKAKNERKLSFSSNQNNESTKQSFNTQNTSSSTNKEKDVSKDIKTENNLINLNLNNKNTEIKNKFDEDNIITDNNVLNSQNTYTNKYLENTEVLKVNIKISKNETATFRIKRYDDLFFTISLFCEIYSIDEKLMKPIIIKTLCTLNTIYQIYNSELSKENIEVLKNVKLMNDMR